MCAAGIAPACSTDLKIGFMTIHNTGYRKIRHGSGLLDQLDIRADNAEMVAHVVAEGCDSQVAGKVDGLGDLFFIIFFTFPFLNILFFLLFL